MRLETYSVEPSEAETRSATQESAVFLGLIESLDLVSTKPSQAKLETIVQSSSLVSIRKSLTRTYSTVRSLVALLMWRRMVSRKGELASRSLKCVHHIE